MEQPIQPIAANLWWAIPNQLAGVRKPTAEELAELRTMGIGAIVSVFHESSNLDLYRKVGIPFTWLPIEIDSAPTQLQLQEFQSFVEFQNHLGHAVAVHCSTGKHRTGTLLAAYLIGAGWSYQDAMQTILGASSQVELPTTQNQFLQAFAVSQEKRIMEQPIVENLWWVIPGKLTGVRKPTADEISDLKTAGVGAIVSVLDDSSNLDLYQQAEIPHLWLPTQGGTAPTLEQVQELQNFVDSQNRLGHGVAVHCTNGKRRTGTMLAAYLIGSGWSYQDAMQTIHRAKSDLDLREAQTSFLQNLAEK